mmetsp:Transcript_14606/g.55201  ORF Transcript_14606/g.55201 Transcript_14606/m.55201 type:complete len:181 (+) Transcript_14606:266-808(+)
MKGCHKIWRFCARAALVHALGALGEDHECDDAEAHDEYAKQQHVQPSKAAVDVVRLADVLALLLLCFRALIVKLRCRQHQQPAKHAVSLHKLLQLTSTIKIRLRAYFREQIHWGQRSQTGMSSIRMMKPAHSSCGTKNGSRASMIAPALSTKTAMMMANEAEARFSAHQISMMTAKFARS